MRSSRRKEKKEQDRKWFGEKPRKRNWLDNRDSARLTNCEHCGEKVLFLWPSSLPYLQVIYSGVIDHIVPERLVLKLCPSKAPHFAINLMCLAKKCHGVKGAADRALCEGDKLEFLRILRENNWPMERVEKALAFYGL